MLFDATRRLIVSDTKKLLSKTYRMAPLRIAKIVKRNLWDCLITAVFFNWGFVLLLNGAYFTTTQNILLPIVCFALPMLTIIIGTGLGRLPALKVDRLPVPVALSLAHLLAALSCISVCLGTLYGLSPIVLLPLAVILGALATLLFFYSCYCQLLGAEDIEPVVNAVCSLAIAFLLFVFLITLCAGTSLLLVCSITLGFSALAVFRDYRRERSHQLHQTLRQELDKQRFAANEPLTSASLGTTGIVATISLNALMFTFGFLLAFELNATQKSLHFVSTLTSYQHLGNTALSTLYYLLLMLALMIIVLTEYIHPSVPLAGIILAVLLAVTFFSLPSLTMLNFISVTALASALFFTTLFLHARLLKTIPTLDRALKTLRISITLFALGGLGGAALAYVLLAFTDSIQYYNDFFRVLPAVLIVLIAIIFLLSFRSIAALFRKQGFEKDLDTSLLEHRCHLLSQRFGLTKREAEVLGLLAMGRNIPGISEMLQISNSTVKTHVLQIYKKTGISSRQQLLNIIYGNGKEA
jgi:DNA-binding CsgD family transcriptional regulator